MDRVGGYRDFLALERDQRAYDDVLVALAGEKDAVRLDAAAARLAAQSAGA